MIKLFTYACIFMVAACSSVENSFTTKQSNNQNTVVLIFKDAPIQTSVTNEFLTMSTGNPYSCIRYIDSNLTICNFLPRNMGLDTLVIPAFNGYANVYHTYQVSETVSYLFTAGDTVLISYNLKKRPYAQSLTDVNNTVYYNLALQGGCVEKSDYSAWATLRDELFTTTFRFFKQGGQKKSPALYAKFKNAYINLDSVEQEYNRYMVELKLSLDTLVSTNKINKTQYGHALNTIERNNQLLRVFYNRRHSIKESVKSSVSPIYNDSLAYTLAYHYTIFDAATKLTVDEVQEQNIPPTTKKIMLKHLLIGQNNISHANLLENGYSNDFILKTANDTMLNYGELIKRNTGKVIYVDFWASWCAPCMQEMPASIKLHNEYKNKDVIFIYLAYNDTTNEWKNALKECGISSFKDNYIITNSQSAEFAKEIKLSAIPRFMLYDRKGQLVNHNAPRPSSKEIKEEINKLL